MHPIEQAIQGFLSASAEGKAPFSEAVLTDYLESVKLSILDKFHGEPETGPFKLRMSNIGKDIRQLMLEKKYGRLKPSPEFMMKMLTGSLQEHLLVYILKSAGLDILVGGETKIDIADTTIKGTWDIKVVSEDKIYDVKTASEWSYTNKFLSYDTLAQDDSFGYVDQLLGYCEGDGCEPGGWLVINKSTGQYKVVVYPKKMNEVRKEFRQKLVNTIHQVESPIMPPCRGVEAETFYQKPTGNRILGFKCRFCDHKSKCHPGISHEPSRVSKAKNPKYEYYI